MSKQPGRFLSPTQGNRDTKFFALVVCFNGVMGFWSASSTGTGSAAKAGAVIGSLDIGALNMVLSILSGDAAWQMAIKGLVLLLAVAFGIFNKRRSGGR